MPADITLNDDQQAAIDDIYTWLTSKDDPDDFYVLSGSAGTGKTTCVKQLSERLKGRLVFTAPTNKATKVLREAITTKDYRPDCRTIYSLLGLKLESNGEVKQLSTPDDDIDLSKYRCVVVDEGSMINENLRKVIHQAVETSHVKFLFLGDPAQLPPVGEARSPIWRIKRGASLTKVVRHDNAILALATSIRDQVDHPTPKVNLATTDYDPVLDEGVTSCTAAGMRAHVLDQADDGAFSLPNKSKVVAWRNVTVDAWNRTIRSRIFPEATQPWLVGDRVLFASPGKDLDDEPMASTDDEGTIIRIDTSYHAAYGDFRCWNVSITLDDNRVVVARVLHEESLTRFTERKSHMAEEARLNGRKWRDFWHFVDSFHSLKYAYAITAHRSQGSTYEEVFVDWRDILINRTRSEAYRCLYVAASRAKKRVFLG